VKPTRGMLVHRMGGLSSERRAGLLALGVLLFMLATLVVYQRLRIEPKRTSEPPAKDELREAGTELVGTTPPLELVPAEVREPLTQLAYPLRNGWQVVKEFGSSDQAFGDFRIFSGLAVAAPPSVSVLAGGPGRVIEVDQDPLDGGAVVVDHGAGLLSRYAGLGNILVQLEQKVDTGQELGHIATTAKGVRQSLGSHLYFQVFKDGHSVNPGDYFPN